VLTEQARAGNFRFLTSGSVGGASRRNGNALSTSPSVDLNGNILTRDPVSGASLFVNQANVFTDLKDPNRTGIDPVWIQAQYLKRLPLPNDFSVGDGLNTAGYRWYRRDYGFDGATGQSANPNRNHLTMRYDYQVNDKNKLSFTMTREKDWGVTGQTGLPDIPGGYFGEVKRTPDFYTVQWTNVISPTLLNEFRFGFKRDTWIGVSPFDLGCCFGAAETNLTPAAKEARASYPSTSDGSLLFIAPNLGLAQYANLNVSTPRLTYSPLHQFADTLSWTHGAHTVQFGGEIDRQFSRGVNGGGQQTTRPSITLGIAGSAPVPTPTFAGLSTNDQATAQGLLALLAGSVANIQEQFFVNSPTATDWTDYRKSILFTREHHQNDWNFYVKDGWKASRNLTLNLGLRYDKFGVPYDALGLGGRFTGGQAGLFGISGTSFANAMWNPYAANGSLTTTEFVGKNSPQPDKLIFGNDWNNFAPTFGFAYNVPWFKKTTVIRGGYGWNYVGAVDFLAYSTNIANLPGYNLNQTLNPPTYLNLSGLPATQFPLSTGGVQPFTPVALNGPRNTTITGYTDDRKVPYIQTFNFSIEHQLNRDLTFSVGYAGNKATKLYSNQQINETNIFENGLLDAFNVTRAGGNAPLFDRMLNGLNVPGVGVVNGTTLTGSQAFRKSATTGGFFANNNIGGLANFINTSNAFSAALGNGGILRNGGLPENFIVANPQYGSVQLAGNNTNSTYHSLQTSVNQRYGHGFAAQASYVFSKNLGGDIGANGTRDPRNRSLTKSILSNNRTHVIKLTGTWDLPFGSRGYIGHNATGVLDKVIGGWQLAPVVQWASGAPMSFTTTNGTVGFRASNTADLVGKFTPGSVVIDPSGSVSYFAGLTPKTAPTPNFGGDTSLNARFTNQVIVDAAGNAVLLNPEAGRTGNTALNMPGLIGPGQLGFDLSLSKAIRFTESRSLTFRADAIDAANHPIWGNPTTDINSVNFGKITTAAGNRSVTINVRFDF
jgi:hypothetical protein